jgi:LysR family transcriptional regulator, transcriptional activator of nhaA
MVNFNYKHLHYFWVIAKTGGVAKAGERLHVTPQSISTQMRQLEEAIGEKLWRRAGRKLELTDTGTMVLDYAERIFSVGEDLKEALRDRTGVGQETFRVGISEVVAKTTACSLIAPVLLMESPPKLYCAEGRFADLLSQLAIHKLDLVISDRPMNTSFNVRGFNHLLLECGVAFLAEASLAKQLPKRFPQCLDGAPMLLPTADAAIRSRLTRWFDAQSIHPRIIAEFDDTAMLKTFGGLGSGVFAVTGVVAEEIASQLKAKILGRTEDVLQQIYAVSGERRIRHPAVSVISEAAKVNF